MQRFPAGSAMLPDPMVPPPAPQLARQGTAFEGFSVAADPAQPYPWGSLQGSGCLEGYGSAWGSTVLGSAPNAASQGLHAAGPYLGPLPPLDRNSAVQHPALAGSAAAMPGTIAGGLRTTSVGVGDLRARIASIQQQRSSFHGAPMAVPALLPPSYGAVSSAQQMLLMEHQTQRRAPTPQARLGNANHVPCHNMCLGHTPETRPPQREEWQH